MWVGQKSRSDRDWKERNPPNRGCRGLGWVQSFEERRLRVTKNPFLVTLSSQYTDRADLKLLGRNYADGETAAPRH